MTGDIVTASGTFFQIHRLVAMNHWRDSGGFSKFIVIAIITLGVMAILAILIGLIIAVRNLLRK